MFIDVCPTIAKPLVGSCVSFFVVLVHWTIELLLLMICTEQPVCKVGFVALPCGLCKVAVVLIAIRQAQNLELKM